MGRTSSFVTNGAYVMSSELVTITIANTFSACHIVITDVQQKQSLY